jgi:transposase-like protein
VALHPAPPRALAQHQVEQDHRRIKRLIRPMLGFQSFWTAWRTLAEVEAMAMLVKGQVRAVPANDLPAQRAFVHECKGRIDCVPA